MHITKLDAAGIAFIKSFEGFKGNPYLDSVGIPTIGYGFTYYEDGTRVKLTDRPISKERADALFAHIIHPYELAVDSFTRDDINQGQFNSLVSFAYNEGINKLKGSHLLQKVNNNPADPAIEDEFNKWVFAGGEKLNGLISRRAAESKMYFS